jgi:hypothetical protein
MLITGWRQTIERQYQHWAHKLQDEDKQSRDNVNTGYTRYRMKTNKRETLSTVCTQDTGWRQTIERQCQHWAHKIQNEDKQSRDTVNIGYTRYRMKINNPETLSVSCVPIVDIVSRLFVFILYLVYPMLTVSLDCLSSSSIWFTQCWQCLWIVYLHPVSCVPNVDSVSRLFIVIQYLVFPMLTVSLDCLSSSCILCTQCWQLDTVNIGETRYKMKTNNRETLSTLRKQDTGWRQTIERQYQHWNVDCLSIVCFHPVSCFPNVDIVSRLFVFILYLVCPMLTVSLDCLSSSCILCAQCWQCLSILLCSLTFINCLSTTQWCSTCLDYMSSMKCVLLEAELLILREYVCLPSAFGGIRVAHLLSFCVVLCRFVLFVFVLCLVWISWWNGEGKCG